MKYKYTFLALLLALASVSCSKYGYVSLNFPLEPEAYLPEDINAITVVNRSLTPEDGKDRKVIESIVTAEVAGSDTRASDECVKGVYDAIHALENAELVIPSQLRMYGTGTRELPELLEWDQVREICKKEKADALLVLETFDSNTDLLASTALSQVDAILSTGKPRPVVPGKVNVSVNTYWRLYDPQGQRIIDQYQHNSYMSYESVAGIPPPNALNEVAYNAGRTYIQRYLPSYYVERRRLYRRTSGRAKHQFRAGYRRAETANWEGAAAIWEELVDHARRKTAGRACLNMAVANEVLGNTEVALEWAQRSYEYYGDKLAREYVKVLLDRRRLEL